MVDEVAVQVLGDDPLRLGLHPRRHERREIALRDPVEDELLADKAHRVDRAHAVLGERVVRRGLEQEAVAIGGRELLELLDRRGPIAAVRGTGAGRAVLVGRHG